MWDGDPACEHVWGEQMVVKGPAQTQGASSQRVGHSNVEEQEASATSNQGAYCRCGAWRGHLGLEPTPDLFVRHMVDIFREVRRVLRSDGTLWLNMGDCYHSGDRGGYQPSRIKAEDSLQRGNLASDFTGAPNRLPQKNLKDKDLVGMPWMLAFALRLDGWYLRSEIVWAKGISFCESYSGSVMPESVMDRPTRGHEQVFLLTKSPRYFYDLFAVKERGVYPAGTHAAKGSGTREGNRRGSGKQQQQQHENRQVRGFNERWKGAKVLQNDANDRSRRLTTRTAEARAAGAPHDLSVGYATYDGTRNLRTVWAIGVEPFSEAHFATFPPDLVHPCIAAGTSEKGVCAACGAPWKRVVEQEDLPDDVKAAFEEARQQTAEDHGRDDGFTTRRPNYQRKAKDAGWEPTCECKADIVPATVMDCFSGSGTVGVVCARMQRSYLGIELNEDYVAMAQKRIGAVAPLFAEGA